MARAKKDTKAGKAAAAKWRETMLARHGGVEGLHKFMAERGRKGGLVSTPTGGFGSKIVGKDGLTGRERASLAGAIGGHISRRGKSKAENNG